MQLNSSITEQELQEKAAQIEVLLMDVDGVMTDCKLYLVPGPDGSMVETKGFDAQDGIALQWARWHGIKTGVISGRNSPATLERGRQVGMTWILQGHIEKIPLFEQILTEAGVAKEKVAYIGDDLTDIVLFRRAGLSFAPANARKEAKQVANVTLEAHGGDGAVREVIEILLKARGAWDALLRKYEVVL
jgi:3-deoxy-D-manno-octulosonate 8-phosphate phosphatase (KDO 8-P phosphatase)